MKGRIPVGRLEVGRTGSPEFASIRDHFKMVKHPFLGDVLPYGVFPAGTDIPIGTAVTLEGAYGLAVELSKGGDAQRCDHGS